MGRPLSKFFPTTCHTPTLSRIFARDKECVIVEMRNDQSKWNDKAESRRRKRAEPLASGVNKEKENSPQVCP
ncbi:uncharacterized protein Dyak_GE29071 [Drosophila yakuba]|uniref:Uncharacterized protein n=1 Tax=Drosophila yakuba TaxID=7245 RepID=A0A0R1DQV5_DROYA|nr:uncharacterized protein Dyak_GE29071 [Drosophila yakuba]